MLFAGTPDGVYRVPEDPFDTADRVLDGVTVGQLDHRDGTVFAATKSGLFATADGGETWTDLGVPTAKVHSVHASEEDLYAGVEPAAVYRSSTGGETWECVEGFDAFAAGTEWSTNPRHDHAWVRDVATPADSPEVLLVGVEVGGFVASTDGGDSWCGFDAVPDDVHDVVPVGPDRWVVSCGVGGPDRRGGVFETTDAGGTWVERDLGPYEYVRESCHNGRLYTAGNRDPPAWTPPDAAVFVERDGDLDRVSYPGSPASFVVSWTASGSDVLAGTNDGSILRGPGDWERLGTVPVSEEDRQAWGVRSLAAIDG